MNTHEIIDKVRGKTGYLMVNAGKAERAIFGSPTNQGLTGGVGEKADSFTILAKYDELMGFVTKDNYKVKNGQFYDKETKEVLKPKKVTLIIKMNGEFIEHTEGEDKSIELQVAMGQIEKSKKDGGKDKEKEKELAKREKDLEAKEKEIEKKEKAIIDEESKKEAKEAKKEEEEEVKKEKEAKKDN